MKEYRIRINPSRVLDEVSESSAYIGAKSSEYERVGILQDDADFLKKHFDSSALYFVNALKDVISESWSQEEDSGMCSLGISLPDAFPRELSSELERHANAYFVNDVLARWLVILSRTDAAYYKSQAELELNSLREQVYSKTRPRREWFKQK